MQSVNCFSLETMPKALATRVSVAEKLGVQHEVETG